MQAEITDEEFIDLLRTTIITDQDGDTKYYVGGKLHRLNGPAVEWKDGDLWWMQFGVLHRIDGPAIVYTGGRDSRKGHWYLDGVKYTKKQHERILKERQQKEPPNAYLKEIMEK